MGAREAAKDAGYTHYVGEHAGDDAQQRAQRHDVAGPWESDCRSEEEGRGDHWWREGPCPRSDALPAHRAKASCPQAPDNHPPPPLYGPPCFMAVAKDAPVSIWLYGTIITMHSAMRQYTTVATRMQPTCGQVAWMGGGW